MSTKKISTYNGCNFFVPRGSLVKSRAFARLMLVLPGFNGRPPISVADGHLSLLHNASQHNRQAFVMSSDLSRVAAAWLIDIANGDSSDEDRPATVNSSDRRVTEVFSAVQFLQRIPTFHREITSKQMHPKSTTLVQLAATNSTAVRKTAWAAPHHVLYSLCQQFRFPRQPT